MKLNPITCNLISSKKMHLKMLSAKWRPFCFGLKVFISLCLFVINTVVHVELWIDQLMSFDSRVTVNKGFICDMYRKMGLFCSSEHYTFVFTVNIHVVLNSLWPNDTIDMGQHWIRIWVNFGSGNGLLPHGTKPLPEPMLTCYMYQ